MNPNNHDELPPEPGGDALLKKPDVAQWLDVCVGTVDNLRKDGKLPAIKVGSKVRFKRRDVERYLESEREIANGAEVAVRIGVAQQAGEASRNGRVIRKELGTASRSGAAQERKPTK
jgi:excisionase family DNA binding protein